MLLIIAIVGTTVAPWQLFFQQSYVIDKRITPRFMRYARTDLWIGIVLVIIGAVAMMAFTAATFAGHEEFGNFQDAGAVAAGLGKYVGHIAGVFFAIALIDASIIGVMAVSLWTAYAIGDVLSLRHSLHRKPKEAKAFYAVYGGLVALAAALVLTPGTPLGLLTNAVPSPSPPGARFRDGTGCCGRLDRRLHHPLNSPSRVAIYRWCSSTQSA
jgi:Mn2+/Fe2+ NRAMP family transporter